MKSLIEIVERLKKDPIKETIDLRMKEFEDIPRNFEGLFRELVFCILTAGTSAELGIKTINHLGNTIFVGSEKDMQKKLKEVYRFHTIRAGYIYQARKNFINLDINDPEIRMKLVRNIKGIGMKEASHFLRNIGMKNTSIIDFHIIDLLEKHGVIEKPKTLTLKKYLEIEELLKKLAEKTNTNLGELDLYLWYEETGKVLK
jgi:N-glycosylase/DNA lyase